MSSDSWARTHAHTRAHPPTALLQAPVHTRTHPYTPMHTCSHLCTPVHTCAKLCTPVHIQAHTHTHTRTHTRAHTRAHPKIRVNRKMAEYRKKDRKIEKGRKEQKSAEAIRIIKPRGPKKFWRGLG